MSEKTKPINGILDTHIKTNLCYIEQNYIYPIYRITITFSEKLLALESLLQNTRNFLESLIQDAKYNLDKTNFVKITSLKCSIINTH